MKKALIILLLFGFAGCRTAKKTVDKQKTITATEVKVDSSSNDLGIFKSQSSFEGFTVDEFAQSLNWLDWNYIGAENDSFSIEINQTPAGYKVITTGSGLASGGSTYEVELKQLQQYYDYKIDSLGKVIATLKYATTATEKHQEEVKSKDVKSDRFTSFIVLFTPIIIFLTIVISVARVVMLIRENK